MKIISSTQAFEMQTVQASRKVGGRGGAHLHAEDSLTVDLAGFEPMTMKVALEILDMYGARMEKQK